MLVVLIGINSALAQTQPSFQPPTPATTPPVAQQPAASALPVIDQPLQVVALTIIMVEAPTSKLSFETPPQELLPLIEKLARENELTLHTRLQLATADGQPGFTQSGEQINIPTGDARVVGGRVSTRSFVRQSIGTVAKCTPRVVEGGIVAALEIEDSRMVPAVRPMDATEEPVADLPPTMQTVVARTIVTIPTGRAVVIGGQQSTTPDGKSRQSLILVTAKVLE
jgi:type II secretory pathway component GspD/PulD (secretin)